ncbi:MAG TPA: SusC/RagA family TonB-linked outer membrane protein [Mucilaginibacter sp.]|jgi:TonB-linked SusC/RagA family outer membrane protein|nr:SusC/RagA family TonB-linked outer membrane protein [Mucilaginibacter sp.]
MKKKLLLIIGLSLAVLFPAFAQNHTVTGTVTAKDDGLPVPGVSVKIKGTNTGVQTGDNGKYTISVPANSVLVFSYIGFTTQSITVGSNPVLNVVLENVSQQLGEVVVTTALGVKHSEKELGYSTAEVTAKQVTATAATNVANGLTGKVAGLAVYELDNSVDPNIAIVLRGNRSLEGNNNALIVLDGVPMPGALLSSINPNDIADISILKGAGAAAIYGSEASNGVVAITTKRGSATNKPTITYENSVQAEKVAFYPKLQTSFGTYGGEGNYINGVTGFTEYVPYENQEYGPAYNGQLVQLGPPLDSANGRKDIVPYKAYPVSPIDAFFKTGITEQNDISYSQGDAKNSIFVSAQNAYRTTVVPNDKNIRNAFSVRGHHTDGIFSVDYSVEYSKTTISTYIGNNNPLNTQYGITLPGSYVTTAGANDLYSSILQLPAFYNIKAFEDPNSDLGNASNYPDAYAINPYWIVDEARRDIQRDVLLGQIKLAVDPTKWLNVSYHLSDNFGIDQERYTKAEVDFTPYSISDPFGAGSNPAVFKSGKSPGSVYDVYQYGDGTNNNPGFARIQGDALVDLHPNLLKNFKTDLLVGNSIYQLYDKYQITGSSQLLVNDFYNINTIGGQPVAQEADYVVRNISFFGDLNINYKGFLNLEGTYRNEQDSRLSKAERSFNYPSAKISFVPTDIISSLKNSDVLTYAKFYASLSQVGNINIGPYEIYNTYGITAGFPYGSLGGLTAGTTNFSPTLKPEITTETEVGTELAFFKNRFDFNFSYYNSYDRNQTVPISTTIATGYSTSILNIGETQSQGYEFQVTGQVFTTAASKVGWTLGGNLSINNSKVISLLPGVSQLSLGGLDYAVVGQPFPLLKGTDFIRDPAGQAVVGATGYPQTASALTTFGRTTPKYDLGVTSTWSYKFVSLSAVFEYRGGDVVYNAIGNSLAFTGASYYSASNGRQRFIYPNSVIQTGPNTYVPNTSLSVQDGNYGFWQTSQFQSTNSPWVTSGAFWKLREVNLTFNLDKFIKQTKYMKGLSVALTGRNLFIWTPKENTYTDPEFSDTLPTSSARGFSDINELPGTRVFGGSVKVTF